MSRSQKGFTITELMIATSVFSIILLVGSAAFVTMGRSYYKGITVSQTQQVARQIINNVSANIRLGSSVSSLNTASQSRYFYCVGGKRYTFQLYKMLDTSSKNTTNNFGLLVDEPSGDGCGNPYDAPVMALSNPTELLANNMRLLAFSITPVGTGSAYTVSVTVAFGQDSVLTDPNSASAECTGLGNQTQFCAVTRLSTVVYQGVSV